MVLRISILVICCHFLHCPQVFAMVLSFLLIFPPFSVNFLLIIRIHFMDTL
ncbi:hypothetical protein CLOBOL_01350 [Enterocloster bolteae ATCC BAA-613]|uniref:Uncharacterized protein n=1 Tax=Enterocloster bolteae (strain ATCC BAA-613 / DSM 15670 / CCUG 46953 / JCM 12243 / WAL 16351) TaxID=411902 RepID=A8RKK6_ENTBW|nr:hypothetical protein CLOBOL_01350 [Enterocloster bolteae ATCC BAA-613]